MQTSSYLPSEYKYTCTHCNREEVPESEMVSASRGKLIGICNQCANRLALDQLSTNILTGRVSSRILPLSKS